MVRSRLPCSSLHSITIRRVWSGGAPVGHTTSRSVRIRPSPYSRSTRPPEFTMHCSAASANRWPLSAVCWTSSVRTSASEKSPMRSEAALTLKALPPVMTVFSADE